MKITQSNAETFVRERHQRAKCQAVSGHDGSRSYMVYLDGGLAGEMYLAYGNSKPAAWKAAAIILQERELTKAVR